MGKRSSPTLRIEHFSGRYKDRYIKRTFTEKVKRTGKWRRMRKDVNISDDEFKLGKMQKEQYDYDKRLEAVENYRSNMEEYYRFVNARHERPFYFSVKRGDKRFTLTILNHQRHLYEVQINFLASFLHIPYRTLCGAFLQRTYLRMDYMVKLCRYLMIPDVEYAFNYKNIPPTLYIRNRWVYLAPPEWGAKENWNLFPSQMALKLLLNEFPYPVDKCHITSDKFIQNIPLERHERREVVKRTKISRYTLYRILNNRRIAKADEAFQIIWVINKLRKRKYFMREFWYFEGWEEDRTEYKLTPRIEKDKTFEEMLKEPI